MTKSLAHLRIHHVEPVHKRRFRRRPPLPQTSRDGQKKMPIARAEFDEPALGPAVLALL